VIKLIKLKCKIYLVRENKSSFFLFNNLLNNLDRLSAKISAQTLELKENYAKINNYEKELARVC
jgi:hypothetical protein